MYAPENPEFKMEKYRFYVELPGDFWENSPFMDELKYNMAPLRDENGYVKYGDLLQVGQVHPELVMLDPNDA